MGGFIFLSNPVLAQNELGFLVWVIKVRISKENPTTFKTNVKIRTKSYYVIDT